MRPIPHKIRNICSVKFTWTNQRKFGNRTFHYWKKREHNNETMSVMIMTKVGIKTTKLNNLHTITNDLRNVKY